MRGEPSLALQATVIAALKADTDVAAIVSGRVYDRIPETHRFPYVRVGDDQVIANKAECFEGSVTVYSTLHAFSRPQEDSTNATQPRGRVESKLLTGAIIRLLDENTNLAVEDYTLVIFEFEDSTIETEPDGLTEHAMIRFRAELDPAI